MSQPEHHRQGKVSLPARFFSVPAPAPAPAPAFAPAPAPAPASAPRHLKRFMTQQKEEKAEDLIIK